MVPVKLYNEIAKEFGINVEHLKMAQLTFYPGSTPMLQLTIELDARQVNALHWIKEGA